MSVAFMAHVGSHVWARGVCGLLPCLADAVSASLLCWHWRSVCFSCLRTHNANFYCFYQRLFSPFIVMISGIDYHLGTVEPGEQRSAELSCGALGFAVNCAQRCVCVMFAEETFLGCLKQFEMHLKKIQTIYSYIFYWDKGFKNDQIINQILNI